MNINQRSRGQAYRASRHAASATGRRYRAMPGTPAHTMSGVNGSGGAVGLGLGGGRSARLGMQRGPPKTRALQREMTPRQTLWVQFTSKLASPGERFVTDSGPTGRRRAGVHDSGDGDADVVAVRSVDTLVPIRRGVVATRPA